MRLGLLGGSFDPVHYGHLLLAECAREQIELDAVWFVPAAQAPHKRQQRQTPVERRIEMLELAVAGHPALGVCRLEAESGGVNYTVDTLRHLCREQPGDELFFLVGADMLRDLPNWREPGEICRLATIVAVGRAGNGEPEFATLADIAPPDRLEWFRRHRVDMPPIGISSTDLRRRAAKGASLRYRTPPAVEQYIAASGLYDKPQ